MEKICYTLIHCGDLCKLNPRHRDFCKVRFNSDGTLMIPFRYSAGLQNKPIEIFLHALPDSLAMISGMLGCDFRCTYCHNWFVSESLKDNSSRVNALPTSVGEICGQAIGKKSRVVVSTYNDPLITS